MSTSNELTHTYEELTDSYKVSLTRDGITASTWASSFHLIEGKRKQLEAAITRMAAEAVQNAICDI
jgi:hypothetical protein